MTPTPEAMGPDDLRALVQKYIGTPREVIVGGHAAADAWERDIDDWKDDADTLHSIAEDLNVLRKRLEAAERLCKKFVDKVESGRAHSRETYADCKAFLAALAGEEP